MGEDDGYFQSCSSDMVGIEGVKEQISCFQFFLSVAGDTRTTRLNLFLLHCPNCSSLLAKIKVLMDKVFWGNRSNVWSVESPQGKVFSPHPQLCIPSPDPISPTNV